MKGIGYYCACLSITIAHALAVHGLPEVHADPFDRLLVTQARAEGLMLVTADRIFVRYGIATIDATR
jgi:PIN domain nuclease of toxin-antitoxin system